MNKVLRVNKITIKSYNALVNAGYVVILAGSSKPLSIMKWNVPVKAGTDPSFTNEWKVT